MSETTDRNAGPCEIDGKKFLLLILLPLLLLFAALFLAFAPEKPVGGPSKFGPPGGDGNSGGPEGAGEPG